MLHYLSNIFISIGCLFIFTSVAGFVKFQDPFRMMHVGGVCELVGIPLLILGCGLIFLENGNIDAFLKTIFISVIFYIISPVGTNAISESACRLYGDEIHLSKHDKKI